MLINYHALSKVIMATNISILSIASTAGIVCNVLFYKIIQIVCALWLAIKSFYMSVCKHGFHSSFISYFIKEM